MLRISLLQAMSLGLTEIQDRKTAPAPDSGSEAEGQSA